MAQQELYLVFGGTLADPRINVFSDPRKADIVGLYPSYDEAFKAWQAKSQQHVDDAYMRYFVAPLHKLINPDDLDAS